MSKNSVPITIFKDGATMRSRNKQVAFKETDDDKGVLIQFRFADEEADKPACHHTCLKGKVRQTHIKLSHEAMGMLLMGYHEYMINKTQ